MSRVAVLVAAYNAEKWLRQCLDSLLHQTMTDWMAVCADDASMDSTPRILAEYASRDPRIRFIRLQSNSGIAKARNAALAVAEGEFVCMLDSDDWMEPDALEQALEVVDSHPETDTVLFQVDEVFDDHVRRYPMIPFDVLTGERAFEESLTWNIHGVYMVRSEIHRRYPYDETAIAYSDENITRVHYLHSREVRQCDGVYCYRQHNASITHRVSARRFDYLLANESMMRLIRDENVAQRILEAYERLRWLNLMDVYMFYFKFRKQLTVEERKAGVATMRHTWKNIQTNMVPLKLRMKFGYMPLRPFWPLFVAQEEIYFTLRKWMGRI